MTRKEIYDSIKNNLAELRKFFAEMPKGGDLHNHLTGSAYAETYFEVACENNMYATKKGGNCTKMIRSPLNLISNSPKTWMTFTRLG